MYFYYFLGHCLEARDDLTRAQKDARAMNTYCLALGNILNSVKISNKWPSYTNIPVFVATYTVDIIMK